VRFVGVSLDCADLAELADFYLKLLGGRLLWSHASSAGVQVPGVLLVLQRVADYRPPVWPGASIVHLDLTAGEQLDESEQRAVALGPRRKSAAGPAVEGAVGPGGPPVLHYDVGTAAGASGQLTPQADPLVTLAADLRRWPLDRR